VEDVGRVAAGAAFARDGSRRRGGAGGEGAGKNLLWAAGKRADSRDYARHGAGASGAEATLTASGSPGGIRACQEWRTEERLRTEPAGSSDAGCGAASVRRKQDAARERARRPNARPEIRGYLATGRRADHKAVRGDAR